MSRPGATVPTFADFLAAFRELDPAGRKAFLDRLDRFLAGESFGACFGNDAAESPAIVPPTGEGMADGDCSPARRGPGDVGDDL